MQASERAACKAASPYSGSLTREQFLFYEMRITAQLLHQGMSPQEAHDAICADNLYQFPTERLVSNIASVCLKRLETLDSEELVAALATKTSDVGKQICLYAMMKQYRLIWDFMIVVIGEKYRNLDYTLGNVDMLCFFESLQEQDDWVATWSDATITKIKQVIKKMLIENGYLDSPRSTKLNPVWLHPIVERAIREQGNSIALPAFNCFF